MGTISYSLGREAFVLGMSGRPLSTPLPLGGEPKVLGQLLG